MSVPTLLATPYLVTDDTWLIPTYLPAMPGTYVGGHSLVIRGEEPIIVDTGSSLLRERWLEDVFSLVEPDDVRWVFLSHDDHDHVGNLLEVVEMCRHATVVTNFGSTARLAADIVLPPDRMRWLDHGGSFDAGDRTLHVVRPPMFDSPATRGLHDSSTNLLWAVDSFGSLVHDVVYEVDDIPTDLYDESFHLLNSWNTPWMEWLDVERYSAHVDATRRLPLEVVVSAHGPVLRGAHIDDAFDRTLALAGRPAMPTPGQETLDQLVAAALAPQPAMT